MSMIAYKRMKFFLIFSFLGIIINTFSLFPQPASTEINVKPPVIEESKKEIEHKWVDYFLQVCLAAGVTSGAYSLMNFLNPKGNFIIDMIVCVGGAKLYHDLKILADIKHHNQSFYATLIGMLVGIKLLENV
jgi:hypothetical protein